VGSTEVPPSTVFRSGERVRLKVEVNDEGYLYLVAQGTSGKWEVLYPAPNMENGLNHVKPGRPYVVPDEKKSAFTFKGKTGTEKLFLVLSREPEAKLDELIYDLGDQKAKTPAGQKPATSESKTMLAQNRVVDDPVIAKLRSTGTRDLVLESVEEPGSSAAPDDRSAAGTRDQGFYVVNTSGSVQARVVVDIKLVHR